MGDFQPEFAKIDILLRPTARTQIVVEVKKPGTLDDEAIKQAARYVRAVKQDFGITTDGLEWVYFQVRPRGRSYRIHQLLRFHIPKHQKLALLTFQRSQKTTLKRFLEMLSAIHQGMTQRDIVRLLNKDLQARVDFLVVKAREAGVQVTAKDKKVIGQLYEVTEPSSLTGPLCTPIRFR